MKLSKVSEKEAVRTYYSGAKGLIIEQPNIYRDVAMRAKSQRENGVSDSEILDSLIKDCETASAYQRDYFSSSKSDGITASDLVRVGDVFVDPYGRVYRYKYFENTKFPENIALQSDSLKMTQFELIFSLETGWDMDLVGNVDRRTKRLGK